MAWNPKSLTSGTPSSPKTPKPALKVSSGGGNRRKRTGIPSQRKASKVAPVRDDSRDSITLPVGGGLPSFANRDVTGLRTKATSTGSRTPKRITTLPRAAGDKFARRGKIRSSLSGYRR